MYHSPVYFLPAKGKGNDIQGWAPPPSPPPQSCSVVSGQVLIWIEHAFIDHIKDFIVTPEYTVNPLPYI